MKIRTVLLAGAAVFAGMGTPAFAQSESAADTGADGAVSGSGSDRVERDIVPALKAGAIVLADRYVYTAFARDVARGVNSRWVRSLYRHAVVPTH